MDYAEAQANLSLLGAHAREDTLSQVEAEMHSVATVDTILQYMTFFSQFNKTRYFVTNTTIQNIL